jgi:hypothetical protein
MDGINGAAWRLMIHIWALSPYGVLAGMLMFSNKQGMTALGRGDNLRIWDSQERANQIQR